MKIILEWIGLISGGSIAVNLIGELSKYTWWECVFLFFFVLLLSIFLGGATAAIYEPLVKFYDKWIGKKNLKRLA